MMKFLTNCVAGIRDEEDIQYALYVAGLQSFRKMAGYIPDVMALGNEPKPMLRDWRSCPFRKRFSDYHYRWVKVNLGLDTFEMQARWSVWEIPYADRDTYQECCQLSSNRCQLVQTQRVDGS